MAVRDLTIDLVDAVGSPIADQYVSIRVDGDAVYGTEDGVVVPVETGDQTGADGRVVFRIRPSAELTPDADYVVRVPLENGRPGEYAERAFTMPDADSNLRELITD